MGKSYFPGLGYVQDMLNFLNIFSLNMLIKKVCLSYRSNSCKERKIHHQKHESFKLGMPLTKMS